MTTNKSKQNNKENKNNKNKQQNNNNTKEIVNKEVKLADKSNKIASYVDEKSNIKEKIEDVKEVKKEIEVDKKEIEKEEKALETIEKPIPTKEVAPAFPDLKREDFGVEMWLNVDILRKDNDAQRSQTESQVKKITGAFKPSSFGRISVSHRKDGFYYVTDGWHRVLSCRQLGIPEVPCIVIENEEDDIKQAKKQDALQFLTINENTSAVSAIDKYRVGVAGEVETWLRVKEVVEYNNLKVGTSASRINAVASIYKYINSSNKPETIAKKMEHMKITLGILNNVTGVEGITNISINAMCLFVREYISEGIITEDDALNVFAKINLRQMITNAQTLKNTNTGGNVITSLAYLLYKEYNNITKGVKLPPRFEI